MTRLLGRRDDGAIAVMSALLAVLLFSIGALAVDLGNLQARRRITQSTADLAALAGAQGLPDAALARTYALDYLLKNPVFGQAFAACPGCYSDGDGPDYANGEIIVTDSAGNTVTTGTGGKKVRVIVPRRTVPYGLAGVMGFNSGTVHAAATTIVGSPGKGKILPFGVSATGGAGLYCIHTNSPGQNSVLRSALLANEPISLAPNNGPPAGGTVVTVSTPGATFVASGNNRSRVLINGSAVATTFISAMQVQFTSPAQAGGPATYSVAVRNGGNGAPTTQSATFTYNPPPPGPTVTSVTATSGNPGDTVVVTGTGFSPGTVTVAFGANAGTGLVVNSSTKLTVVVPAGSGAVDVIVTVNGTPSTPSPNAAADDFTYLVDPCLSATGNFGYLDLKGWPNPNPLEQNIIKGARYNPGIFPNSLLPAPNTECKSGSNTIPGAIIDNGTDNSFNCADVQNGNTVSSAAKALLDGIGNPSLAARLLDPPIPPCAKGSVKGRSNIENDSLAAFLTVSLSSFQGMINNPNPTPGIIKKEIYDCPRFFLVPVLNITGNQANGFYPITKFFGTFIEDFETNGGGSQVTAIKAYVFSLDWIASPGAGGGTIPYVGSGPRIPILVHDAYDLPS